MQETAPLVCLVAFILLSLVCGFMAYTTHSEIEGPDPATTHLDRQIEKAREEVRTAEEDARKLEIEIEVNRDLLRQQRARFEYLDALANEKDGILELAYKARRTVVEAGKKFETQATELGAKITELKGKTKGQIRQDEGQLRERTDADVKKLQEEKEGSLSRAANEKNASDREDRDFRQRRNFEQSSLDEFRRQLDYLTTREVERATVLTEPDGRVILADPVHNSVFINLGTAQGVRNGFRFECFGLKPGNRKIHKAYLEVRRVSGDLAECFILTKPIRLPKDPLSDYVASQPEEQYSPYQESGKKGYLLQGLTGAPKTVIMTMNPDYPIVEGDYVQNPLFAPGKGFTFYIAGDKTVAQGRQKSAIAYAWPHIERVVQAYGGKVVKKVELGVDYIIAQKNPQDDSEFTRAVSLGIPVIYEWELFRFLDLE